MDGTLIAAMHFAIMDDPIPPFFPPIPEEEAIKDVEALMRNDESPLDELLREMAESLRQQRASDGF
ncbi:hypothetical protein KZX46_22040 (plasmid) [Polymorphobacter sp. PAMC 29334]|uniref:hypothetical protein n=1 Tax=Polymorphobacter sp. PAMC 29334 TaxID=2862331 RepID=UPI001C786EC9|nr:hypothetical protein [Polymorphobacter sp. PAMC 29334]QYE37078.1 hypothetical protein KZX46_22040 [Polymorphobacter sp. PAMC 29334]